MVRHQHHPLPVKHLLGPGLPKLLDGNRRGNVIPQRNIHPGQDQFARLYVIFAAMRRQNLLRNCLSFRHAGLPSLVMLWGRGKGAAPLPPPPNPLSFTCFHCKSGPEALPCNDH